MKAGNIPIQHGLELPTTVKINLPEKLTIKMAKSIDKITEEFCKNLPPYNYPALPDKSDYITIDELSERCQKAAEIYGSVFHEYLLSKYVDKKEE